LVPLDLEGRVAPPRSNGELLFAEPWESRVFGVAVSLAEAGYFEWADFQAELIAAIARWESTHDPDEPFSYYTCWLQALESLLDRLGVVGAEQVAARLAEHSARPHGHDHYPHDHDDHDHHPHAGAG
jgi:nitrile hydratase accessory protein